MKTRSYLIASLVTSLVATASGAYAQQVQVTVDGGVVHFRGQPPVEVDDRVLVPLRGVFEQLGAQVNWNPGNQTVTARRDDTQVHLRIGERTASVNGEAVQLDVPAQIIDDSTMVPLRFVGEALGDRVHWDEATQTVSIITGGDEFARDHHDEGDYARRPQRDDWRDKDDNPPAAPPVRTRIVEEDVPPPPDPAPYILETDTVVPVNIDLGIDLDHCRPGQRITAVVPAYPGLPPYSEFSGVVRQVGPGGYGRPPLLDITFDSIETKGGRRYHIDGRAVEFNTNTVVRSGDGIFRANGRGRDGFVRVDRIRKIGVRLNEPIRLGRDMSRDDHQSRPDRMDRNGRDHL